MFLQGLIATQREETARNEPGYLRTLALREIDGLSAALFPKPRILHLIKDRYHDQTRTKPTGYATSKGCTMRPGPVEPELFDLATAGHTSGSLPRSLATDPVRTLYNQCQKVYPMGRVAADPPWVYKRIGSRIYFVKAQLDQWMRTGAHHQWQEPVNQSPT